MKKTNDVISELKALEFKTKYEKRATAPSTETSAGEFTPRGLCLQLSVLQGSFPFVKG